MTTASPTDYRLLASEPVATTDGFHSYRLMHAGGETGSVTLYVDGQETLRVPYTDLSGRAEVGWNVVFGPNAAHGEGRVQVAAFGYRIGGTDPVLQLP
jgi:acyl-coenzyme A synthetase/AMP-(fatty) acid ligase